MSPRTRSLPTAVSLSISEYFCLIAIGQALLLVGLHAQLQDARARAQKAEATVATLTIPAAPTAVSDGSLHARLLGLQGGFGRVVVVVDRSASMKADHRWAEVRAVIDAWMRHLPIEHMALIVYNDAVDVFPESGGYLDLASPDRGAVARGAALAYLQGIKPSGNTNTLSALQRAYAYPEVDSILLFSDGFPDRGRNRFDRAMARSIYALCRRHGRSVPINVVGVGKYLEPQLGEFLVTLSRLTGGTFIGR